MSNGDIAMQMILAQADRVKLSVEAADYSRCPPGQKDVQLFLVNGMTALLHCQTNGKATPGLTGRGMAFLGGGGIGAGLLAGIELFGRAKGWW